MSLVRGSERGYRSSGVTLRSIKSSCSINPVLQSTFFIEAAGFGTGQASTGRVANFLG